ncbi:neurochondrin -like protein [Brachionus plicatilis]|uniref:Neurochondrin-like protein n=1 Tax=Brachionus plicatilis TaxID=10195 RepID=A0A3M7QNU6_BRAPC|nr:neurochondrin -like protein [Brachionus plicatilis]
MNLDYLINSLQSAENDNKKFALLLILSELFKSHKLDESIKTDENLNIRLFESIDPHFLARLITTKQLVNDSPIQYKQVGLSILTQFLDFPELITNPVLLTKIDSIFEIIKSDFADSDFLKLDAYKLLYRLSEICPEFLYQNGLIEIIINDILLNEKYSSQELRVIYDFDLEDEKNFQIVSCKILSNLIQDMQRKAKEEKVLLGKTCEKVEESFKKLLNCAVSVQSDDLLIVSVMSILSDVFKSKVKPLVQEQAFLVLSNFVSLYDFEPVYMKDRSFFYLLIHLLCIQLSLSLHKSYETNELSVDQELMNKMSVYYGLLEQVIKILSTASPFDTNDSEEDCSDSEEKEAEPEFGKVIKIVVEALEAISLFIKDNIGGDFSQMDDNSLLLLASSIRVLLCWMTHESLLEDEILDLIPRMIEFSEYLESKGFELNVSQFVSAGLKRLLSDKKHILEFKLSNPKYKDDMVKIESESMEIKEQIDSIQSPSLIRFDFFLLFLNIITKRTICLFKFFNLC